MRNRLAAVVGAVVVLVLGLLSPFADAAGCTGKSVTDCYADATCRFNAATSECVDGAAATCFELYRDATECAQVGMQLGGRMCAVNSLSGQCVASTMLPCSAHNADTNACIMRRDCKPDLVAGTCVEATDKCGQYADNAGTCASAGCFFDGFIPSAIAGGRCFSSLMEVNTFYAPSCSFWSHYATGDACKTHGCAWQSGLCFSTGSGAGVDTVDRVVSSWSFNLADVAIADFPYLTARVVIPLDQYFDPLQPMHHALVIGTPPSGADPASSLAVPLANDTCNTLARAMPAFGDGRPRIDPIFQPGAVQLTSQFVAATTATSNLTYSTAGPGSVTEETQLAIYQAIGYNDVGTHNASIIQRVAVTGAVAGTINVELFVKFDVRDMKKCGVVEKQFADHKEYVSPLTLYVRQGSNTAQATVSITSKVFTHGVVQVGATQHSELDVKYTVIDTAVGAPSDTKKKRKWTIFMMFRVSDPNKIVGLNMLEHVMMTPNGQPADVGLPTNCFGTHHTAVRPPTSCPGSVCVTEIDFETDYISTEPNGNSLNLCGFRDRTAHLADMDVDVNGDPVPYPVTLNKRHDFYYMPYEWTVGAELTGTGYAGQTYVGRDATEQVPDLLGVTLDFPTKLSIGDLRSKLQVKCGLLPTPDSGFEDMIHTFDTDDDDTVPRPIDLDVTGFDGSVVDMRNDQLRAEAIITIACHLVDPGHRRDLYMHLNVTGEIEGQTPFLQMYPLNAAGRIIPGIAPLSWKQLKPVAVRVPKSHAGGLHGKAATDVRGVDSFSIPVAQLRNLLYAEGYAFMMHQYTEIPDDETTGSGGNIVASRRLLQAAVAPNIMQQGNAGLLLALGPDGNATSHSSMLMANLGSPASSAGIGVGVVLGATGGGALLVNGALFALGVL